MYHSGSPLCEPGDGFSPEKANGFKFLEFSSMLRNTLMLMLEPLFTQNWHANRTIKYILILSSSQNVSSETEIFVFWWRLYVYSTTVYPTYNQCPAHSRHSVFVLWLNESCVRQQCYACIILCDLCKNLMNSHCYHPHLQTRKVIPEKQSLCFSNWGVNISWGYVLYGK